MHDVEVLKHETHKMTPVGGRSFERTPTPLSQRYHTIIFLPHKKVLHCDLTKNFNPTLLRMSIKEMDNIIFHDKKIK